MGGDSEANAISQEQMEAQQNFYNQLTTEMQNNYGQQQAIYNQMQKAFAPILNAGPNQYGYSAGEQSALSSESLTGTAEATKQAQQSLGAAVGARNSTGLPSGVYSQLSAAINDEGALQNANQQLGIRQSGYQQGAHNFDLAAQALGSVASGENPLGYAGAVNNANEGTLEATNMANNMNSFGSNIGAILGGLGGMATAAATGMTAK